MRRYKVQILFTLILFFLCGLKKRNNLLVMLLLSLLLEPAHESYPSSVLCAFFFFPQLHCSLKYPVLDWDLARLLTLPSPSLFVFLCCFSWEYAYLVNFLNQFLCFVWRLKKEVAMKHFENRRLHGRHGQAKRNGHRSQWSAKRNGQRSQWSKLNAMFIYPNDPKKTEMKWRSIVL